MKIGMRKTGQADASAVSFDALPADIAAKLRQTARRIQAIIWMRGLLAVVAALAVSILAIMAVDAMVTIYASGVRWALWGCGVAAVAATAFRMLVRPLSKPFTPARLAALIERNHPELEERLSTVVELLSEPGTVAEGSSQLLEVLTVDAVRDVMHVSPRREFTARTVKPKLVAAAIALGVLALLFAIWPKSMGRLVLRAVLPSAQVDNLYAENLAVTPGDAVVIQGAPVVAEPPLPREVVSQQAIGAQYTDPTMPTGALTSLQFIFEDKHDAKDEKVAASVVRVVGSGIRLPN